MTYQDQLDAATCANLATAGADRRARRPRSRRRRRGERDQRRDVENHGSIFLLRSRTAIGETFIEDHAPEDALRRRAHDRASLHRELGGSCPRRGTGGSVMVDAVERAQLAKQARKVERVSKSTKVCGYVKDVLKHQKLKARLDAKLAALRPLKNAVDTAYIDMMQRWADLSDGQKAEAQRIVDTHGEELR
jgi:hypothetical protein